MLHPIFSNVTTPLRRSKYCQSIYHENSNGRRNWFLIAAYALRSLMRPRFLLEAAPPLSNMINLSQEIEALAKRARTWRQPRRP
jgi:hypothetical protein